MATQRRPAIPLPHIRSSNRSQRHKLSARSVGPAWKANQQTDHADVGGQRRFRFCLSDEEEKFVPCSSVASCRKDC